MEKSAVIFDIDGLLINSEPLWNQAAAEIFRQYGIILTEEQYAITTGLRSKEFVTHWLLQHKIPSTEFDRVEEKIVNLALSLIDKDATLMPGVEHIFQFFLKRDFKIGFHPQVYLDCAAAMHVSPLACICFEDSVYGMTAAKAARMTCVVVPSAEHSKLPHWGLADLKLSSLQNFGDLHFNMLNH